MGCTRIRARKCKVRYHNVVTVQVKYLPLTEGDRQPARPSAILSGILAGAPAFVAAQPERENTVVVAESSNVNDAPLNFVKQELRLTAWRGGQRHMRVPLVRRSSSISIFD